MNSTKTTTTYSSSIAEGYKTKGHWVIKKFKDNDVLPAGAKHLQTLQLREGMVRHYFRVYVQENADRSTD